MNIEWSNSPEMMHMMHDMWQFQPYPRTLGSRNQDLNRCVEPQWVAAMSPLKCRSCSFSHPFLDNKELKRPQISDVPAFRFWVRGPTHSMNQIFESAHRAWHNQTALSSCLTSIRESGRIRCLIHNGLGGASFDAYATDVIPGHQLQELGCLHCEAKNQASSSETWTSIIETSSLATLCYHIIMLGLLYCYNLLSVSLSLYLSIHIIYIYIHSYIHMHITWNIPSLLMVLLSYLPLELRARSAGLKQYAARGGTVDLQLLSVTCWSWLLGGSSHES